MSPENEKNGGSGVTLGLPLLDILMSLADSANMSTGVTLTVGGLLISGNLASAKEYVVAAGEGFAKAQGNEAGIATAKMLADLFQSAADSFKESDDLAIGRARYIFLRDVRFWNVGTPADVIKLGWWCGKLSAVDGCTIGIPVPV